MHNALGILAVVDSAHARNASQEKRQARGHVGIGVAAGGRIVAHPPADCKRRRGPMDRPWDLEAALRGPAQGHAPRNKPCRRRRGGIRRKPVFRMHGNKPWPVFQDDSGSSLSCPLVISATCVPWLSLRSGLCRQLMIVRGPAILPFDGPLLFVLLLPFAQCGLYLIHEFQVVVKLHRPVPGVQDPVFQTGPYGFGLQIAKP